MGQQRRIVGIVFIVYMMMGAVGVGQSHPKIQHTSLVVTKRLPPKPSDAVFCLAQNLFFEGHNEPQEALEAIAATVFNRMRTPGYQTSVCGVIYAPHQYSWVSDRQTWSRNPPQEYLALARLFLEECDILSVMYPVTHFHRVDVSPSWAATLTYRGTYGQHRFYGR